MASVVVILALRERFAPQFFIAVTERGMGTRGDLQARTAPVETVSAVRFGCRCIAFW